MEHGISMIVEVALALTKLREVSGLLRLLCTQHIGCAKTDRYSLGSADAVFLLKAGATLRNVIIGKNQAEGVHCDGHCNLEFVW